MEYQHINWILENNGNELKSALLQEGFEIDAGQALQVFVAADPSEKKRAVDWMVKTYIAGGFLWEDISAGSASKVSETVGWFAEHRQRITGRGKNLSHYQSLADVYTAIQPFLQEQQPKHSGKEEKRRIKEQAFEESILLKREENLLMAVPLTENAAVWWGQGTRWCTAADKNNYFDYYNQKSPLIVLVFPKGLKNDSTVEIKKADNSSETRKFQLWVTSDSFSLNFIERGKVQFMDEADRSVSPETIKQYWSDFESVVNWAFEKNRAAIKFFPEHAINSQMVIDTLEHNSNLLKYIPKKLIDRSVIDYILSQPIPNIKELPQNLLTDQDYRIAFDLNQENITWIPKEKQTIEMCEKALIQRATNIMFVNTDLLREESIIELLEHIEKNRNEVFNLIFSSSMFYGSIPTRLKTSRVNDLLSALSPKIIEFFKPEDITQEMAWRVIKNNHKFTRLIPSHAWTEDMAKHITYNAVAFIRFIPDPLLTLDRVKRALSIVRNRMEDWSWIPQRFIDEQMLAEILKLSEYAKYRFVESIAHDTWTQAMADLAFTANSDFANKIPKQFIREGWEGKANTVVENEKNRNRVDWNELVNTRAERSLDHTLDIWGNLPLVNPIPVLNDPMFLTLAGLNESGAQPRLKKEWDESFLNGLVENALNKSIKL